MKTLRQLADNEEVRYPQAAAILRRDVYVDDILTGATTLSDAFELRRQLSGLCMARGFPLRKWSSNHQALLEGLPAEHLLQQDS